jgi:3-hydroxyisobutyryl-CoA hydrolase
MGGGVGLSLHSPFRVATERTMFAMPETGIGFFPDVGGSFFLSRLDGELGTYLGLTGDRLVAGEVLYAGIATHYLHSSSLPAVEQRLSELSFPNNVKLQDRIKAIDATISEFVSETPPRSKISGELRSAIDFAFAPDELPQILQRLENLAKAEALSDNTRQWADKTLKTLRERSPTSLQVTLRLLRLGKDWKLSEAFQREHSLAAAFMADVPDFNTGVRAKLITKPPGPAAWSPPTIEEVRKETIDALFEPRGARMQLLTDRGSRDKDYTHRNTTGLPFEDFVQRVVGEIAKSGGTRKDIVELFLRQFEGKVGVREKIEEILLRKTQVGADGTISWVPGYGTSAFFQNL